MTDRDVRRNTPELDLADLARRVDIAAEDAIDTHGAKRALELKVTDDRLGAALETALLYMEKSGKRGIEYFAPWFESDKGAEPPPPSSLPPDLVDTWEALSDLVQSPLVRARLNDLCFGLRRGRPIAHAEAAIRAYLQLAARYPSSSDSDSDRLHIALNATHYVGRAIDLARSTKLDRLAEEAIALGLDLAKRSLTDTDAGPGVVLEFLRHVVQDRSCPEEVDELLIQARQLYEKDVWNTMSTIEIQLLRSGLDTATREDLHHQEVSALILAASEGPTVNAMLHLQQAAALAERHHLDDMRREIIARFQELRSEDVGMQRHEYSMQFDREGVDKWIDDLLGEPNLGDSLRGLLLSGPPTGNVEGNRVMAREMPEYAPLQTLFPTLHIGVDGLPVSSSPGDDAEALLTTIEVRKLQLISPLHAMALSKILEKWGPVSADDAVAIFGQAVHVPASVAKAIADAINRHRSGDFEGATFILLPRVERIAREILLRLREPIYIPPTANSPGRYLGLGVLLTILEERGLDPSWSRFLRTYLADANGVNFRNLALHGHVDQAGEGHSTLVIIAALYLAAQELR